MSAAVQQLPQHQRGRVVPQALDAERSILGGILLDAHALPDVQIALKAEDFYREAHRKVFEAMTSLAARGEHVDRVTVKAELERAVVFASVGGDKFIDLLDTVVPVTSNLTAYAKIVAEKATLRRAIEAATATAAEAYEQEGDLGEFLDAAEARVFALRTAGQMASLTPARELLKGVVTAIEKRYLHEAVVTGVPSGLEALDAITTGFQPGELTLIAARPSMGKTALALDIVRAVGKAGGASAFFSLEMPKDQLVQRLIASEGRINSQRLRTGNLQENDWSKMAHGAGVIAESEIYIADQARGVLEMRALSRRLAMQLAGTPKPLKLVVVDYLQLMGGVGGEDRREEEVARNSRELKLLAMQLKIPVIALSQLNRKLEDRPDKRPRMSDLRESGALEQDADLILFPYRGGDVYGDKDIPSGQADIIVAKQRNGPLGDARIAFIADYSSFTNLESSTPKKQPSFFDGARVPEEVES